MTVSEKAFGCNGHTIRMCSGGYLDLLNPDPALITLRDVSRALGNICRFGGQCDVFYCVAEHSIACASLAFQKQMSCKVQLACLMHDAAEAFLGDVVKPLKTLLNPIYGPIEDRMESAIATAFGIDLKSTKSEWKSIDRIMLIAERRALFTPDNVIWTGEDEVERITYRPRFLHPYYAMLEFEEVFCRLKQSELIPLEDRGN